MLHPEDKFARHIQNLFCYCWNTLLGSPAPSVYWESWPSFHVQVIGCLFCEPFHHCPNKWVFLPSLNSVSRWHSVVEMLQALESDISSFKPQLFQLLVCDYDHITSGSCFAFYLLTLRTCLVKECESLKTQISINTILLPKPTSLSSNI